MNIVDQLRRDEGEVKQNGRHVAYQDHLGFWTLGIGRLIDGRRGGGLTDQEADYLLMNDINTRIAELDRRLPYFNGLDEARKGVLINMSFQLGINGLLNFRNTLRHLELGNYDAASREMLNSNWARQTPNRANRLSRQMRTGEWV
jgi:lysozyme